MKPVLLFAAMITFNIIIGALFVISNFQIWDAINPLDYTSPNWGPRDIVYVPRFFVDGEFILQQMIVVLFNYPFWLFWAAMTGNILFAAALTLKAKSKEMASHPPQTAN